MAMNLRRGAVCCALAACFALPLAGCGDDDDDTGGSSASNTTSTAVSMGQADTSPGALGPEGVPLQDGTPLAPADADGQTRDGIKCDVNEQLVYHVHAHLTIYVNGKLRPIPAGVGIRNADIQDGFAAQGLCFYWLHVHAQDGILHIESPDERRFVLRQMFAVWGQKLSRTQVGPAKGKVTTTVDGKAFTGDPSTIELDEGKQIVLNVGTPVEKPEPINFPEGL